MTYKKLYITKKVLYHLYWKEGLTSYDIAKEFNCNPTTVINQLKKKNIRVKVVGDYKKMNFSKKGLYDLYCKQRLTTKQIAKRFSCSGSAILKYLKEYNIKRRCAGYEKLDIPKKYLYHLYWKRGLSTMFIAKQFGCCDWTIRFYMKKYNIKRRPSNVPKPLPKQFNMNSYAYHYFFGVFMGDGYAGKYQFVLGITDKDFMDNFIKQAKKLGFNQKMYIVKKKNRKDIFKVIISSKILANELNDQVKSFKITKGFVEGFIDSEGSVHFNEKIKQRWVCIVNTNKKILKQIQSYLLFFGIKSNIYVNKNKCYRIQIGTKQGLINFHKHFNFSIKRKQDRLDAIVKSYKD